LGVGGGQRLWSSFDVSVCLLSREEWVGGLVASLEVAFWPDHLRRG
jgi:hypothetical protein